MRGDVLEEILSCPSLPSLPAVAVRVIELTGDPNVKLADLGHAIEADQGLVSKVLRTVNSCYYGLRQRCATIEKALVLLGLNPVKSLALSFSLVGAIENENDAGSFDYVKYWRRGLFTAVGARVFAERIGVEDPDEAFLGGLLQDVGMVAMHRALGERYDEVVRGAGRHRNLVAAELRAFDVQHPDVGAMLAERWRLPAALVLPVRYHERPTAAPPACVPLIRCVGLGNIVHDVLTEDDPAEDMSRLYQRAAQWLGIGQAETDELVKRIGAGARELSSLLRLPAGVCADPAEIVRRANERLIEIAASEPRQSAEPGSVRPTFDVRERDPLTGLGTVGTFQSGLRAALEACASSGEALSVVQVRINGISPETLDGDDGAETLLGVATILNKHFQGIGGLVCRVGPAAFGVVAIGIGRLATEKVAEEFRADLLATGQRWAKHGGHAVAASIGVVGVEQGAQSPFSKPEQLAAATLRAVQACEAAGGNCVRVFVPRAA